jgi:hypothetical protein
MEIGSSAGLQNRSADLLFSDPGWPKKRGPRVDGADLKGFGHRLLGVSGEG